MFQSAVATEFNCGFGRAAIRELTPLKLGRKSRCIDNSKRQQEFRQLLSTKATTCPVGFLMKQPTKHPSLRSAVIRCSVHSPSELNLLTEQHT